MADWRYIVRGWRCASPWGVRRTITSVRTERVFYSNTRTANTASKLQLLYDIVDVNPVSYSTLIIEDSIKCIEQSS